MEIQYKDQRTRTLLRKKSKFLSAPKHTLHLWNDLDVCISVLQASENMQDFHVKDSQLKRKGKPSFRPEILRGELVGKISIRLNKEARLVFEPLKSTDIYREDGSVAWENIVGIRILAITPNHDYGWIKKELIQNGKDSLL